MGGRGVAFGCGCLSDLMIRLFLHHLDMEVTIAMEVGVALNS